jgi:hypothetical protein
MRLIRVGNRHFVPYPVCGWFRVIPEADTWQMEESAIVEPGESPAAVFTS